MSMTSSQASLAERCAGAGTSFWPFAAAMAEEVGTPFYVYLPDIANASYHGFASAIRHWGTGRVAFSVKTNPLFALLKDLNRLGAFAEVASAWEFSHAVATGFQSDRIVFNGPLKTEKDLQWILQTPPLSINIDSLNELESIETALGHSGRLAHVGLRLCPPQENGVWSRFGIEMPDELNEAANSHSPSRSLVLRCIHFHLGTQIHNTGRYVEMTRILKELWIRHRLDSSVWLDIGGGFPYDHSVPFEEQTFQPARFFETLGDAWGPGPRPAHYFRSQGDLAAPAMAVISRVVACKPRHGEPTIIVLDSGTNHNSWRRSMSICGHTRNSASLPVTDSAGRFVWRTTF